MTERQKLRVKEGLCPLCGEWSYPYYLCHQHKIESNIRRVLRKFEKMGWVDVEKFGGKKAYKWNGKAPEGKFRKYSPEAMAKMQLPRVNGKPITDEVMRQSILKVVEDTGYPMTEKEIEFGFRQLKTIGKVIHNTDNLISEFKLIQQKKSDLPKAKREGVLYKINFLRLRGVITEAQLL